MFAPLELFRRKPEHAPAKFCSHVVLFHVPDITGPARVPSSDPHTALNFHGYLFIRPCVIEPPPTRGSKSIFGDSADVHAPASSWHFMCRTRSSNGGPMNWLFKSIVCLQIQQVSVSSGIVPPNGRDGRVAISGILGVSPDALRLSYVPNRATCRGADVCPHPYLCSGRAPRYGCAVVPGCKIFKTPPALTPSAWPPSAVRCISRIRILSRSR